MTFLANYYFILLIPHVKTFKIRYTRCLYHDCLKRCSKKPLTILFYGFTRRELFLTYLQKSGLGNIVTIRSIRLQTCWKPQNDRLDLIFVKDVYLVCNKVTRNGRKMVIYESQIFKSLFLQSCKNLNIMSISFLWCNQLPI